MNRTRLSKKERVRQRKINRILRTTGVIFGLIQFVVSIVFMVFLHKIALVPVIYEVLVGVILALLVLFVFITQRWRVPGIATKILSLALIIVLVVSSVYLDVTRNVIDKISVNNSEFEANICVYVTKDSSISKLEDLNNKTCGIFENIDAELTDLMKKHISNDTSVKLNYKGCNGITGIVDTLYNGEVDAIILNSSYVDAIVQMEGYEDFEDKTKVVYSKVFELSVDNDKKEKVRLNKDIMTVYISGIDIEGKPTTKSRSDVNIILTINFKTHQILMINTPRDYYVPLSISNGIRDKLTHAGSYGIDVSIDTISMLYGINIDYYVRVNFTGFEEIIDALGGITIYSDSDYVTLNHNIPIHKGENHLNGLETLGFVRERYSFADGDNQRGKNQMLVIKKVIEKMCTPAMLAKYTDILDAVSENVITDMPYSEISNIAKMQINENPSWDIQTYSVDGTGAMRTTYSSSDTLSVQLPNEKTVAIAKKLLEKINSGEVINVDSFVQEIQNNNQTTKSSSN